MGYYAFDLDGTLAKYAGWKGPDDIGEPIASMVYLVQSMLEEGKTVKIFTARACVPEQIPAVKAWCLKHIGAELEVTNVKDFGMIQLFDDRAVAVETNTGRILGGLV